MPLSHRNLLVVVALGASFVSNAAMAEPAGEQPPPAEAAAPRASGPSLTDAASTTTVRLSEPPGKPAATAVSATRKERHFKTGLVVATAIVLGGSLLVGEIETGGSYLEWLAPTWSAAGHDGIAAIALVFGIIITPLMVAVSLVPGLNAYLAQQHITYGRSVLGVAHDDATPFALGLGAAQLVGLGLAFVTLLTAEEVIVPAPGGAAKGVSWHLLPGGSGAPIGATLVGTW